MITLPFWITSDSHFFHENIVKYADRPSDHEEIMIERWARIIPENGVILHLGDLLLGGKSGLTRFEAEVAPRLPGKKYLILGNHDKRSIYYERLGFTVIKPFSVMYRGYKVSFDHYPKFLGDGKELHVHGHLHSHPYSHDEPTRRGNINCSVEQTEYRPVRATRLLNKAIIERNRYMRTHKI